MNPHFAEDAEIAFILPSFNKLAYCRRAALSFFAYTQRPCVVLMIDDASPYWARQDWNAWYKDLPRDRIHQHRFTQNGGLTRSWNFGCRLARDLGIKYTICGNSDILFTPGWEDGLIFQLEEGDYQLIAPVSNAPGVTNGGKQRVSNYFPRYRVSDNREDLARVAKYLKEQYPLSVVVGTVPVNGFFMMAKTDTWWEGAFDNNHVFDPKNRMTKNEDELQGRWMRKGWRTGFTPSSFIFHYRAVSRGDSFRHQGWHRLRDTEINKPI